MVQRRRLRQRDLADHLRPQVQRGVGILPPSYGSAGPAIDAHTVIIVPGKWFGLCSTIICMRFAKTVFTGAGVWGLAIVTPLLFLFDYIGRQYPPPITHPDIYFGFVTITLAWQVAFLIIGRDPVRFRPLMIAAMIEKFAYVTALVVLYAQGRLVFGQAAVGAPDFILGLLFVAAFAKTA